MTESRSREHSGKANFDDLYEQPDPRAYYQGLGAFGYEVPEHGRRVFHQVLDVLGTEDPMVVDLCCSYGVNAALLKHDLELDDLYHHYCTEPRADLTPDALAEIDREFFAEHRSDAVLRVAGVDAAPTAVDYAVEVGLLDVGLAENLEVADPSRELQELMNRADLITVTGGVGYITERTFDRLLNARHSEPPWVACLCLRTVSYQPIIACLARHGLVTEHLDGVTFPQRRFSDDDERDFALAELSALGVDPAGKESEGNYHVDVYLSRPEAAIRDMPITKVLADIANG